MLGVAFNTTTVANALHPDRHRPRRRRQHHNIGRLAITVANTAATPTFKQVNAAVPQTDQSSVPVTDGQRRPPGTPTSCHRLE